MALDSGLVRLYTTLLAVVGVALLFAPEVAFTTAGDDSQPLVLAQLLGASVLGFAVANWTGRGVLLGSIYGRAIVAGNQAFAFIGTLVLVRSLPTEPGAASWAFLLVLVFGAVLYSVLLFRPLHPNATPPPVPGDTRTP